jgi:polyhydroxyalkanoate synthesis regulator phasin
MEITGAVDQQENDLIPITQPQEKPEKSDLIHVAGPQPNNDDIRSRLNTLIAESDDPFSTETKINTSMLAAKMLNVSPGEVFKNYDTYVKAWTGIDAPPEHWTEAVSDMWKTGSLQTDRGRLLYREMFGEDVSKELAEIDEQMPAPDQIRRSLPVQALKALAEMAPLMLEGLEAGARRGLLFGAGAAGVAAVVGQAGPQLALPEEIVTVPAAFASMFTVGMVSGSTENIFIAESGNAYGALKDEVDEEGNKLPEDLVRYAALGNGFVNAAIETLEIASIPGLGKLFQKAQSKAIKALLFDGTMKNFIINATKKWGRNVAAETAQEIIQESVSMATEALAKEVSNKYGGTEFVPPEAQEILQRLGETAKQSALGFSLLALPGTIAGSTQAAVQARAEITRVAQERTDYVENLESLIETATEEEITEIITELEKTAPPVENVVQEGSSITVTDEKGDVISTPEYTVNTDAVEIVNVGEISPDTARAVVQDIQRQNPGKQLRVSEQASPETRRAIEDLDPNLRSANALIDIYDKNISDLELRVQEIDREIALPEEERDVEFVPEEALLEKEEAKTEIEENQANKQALLEAKETYNTQDLRENWELTPQEFAERNESTVVDTAEPTEVIELPNLTFKQQAKRAFRNVPENEFEQGFRIAEAAARFWGQSLQQWAESNIADVQRVEDAPEGVQQQFEQVSGKAAVSFLDDGRAVVRAAETADISSFIHEIAHIWLRNLPPELDQVVREWTGFQGQWGTPESVTAEEMWSRGFEQYAYEGTAPTSALRAAFKAFSEFLQRIYRSIESLLDLTPEIKKVYDTLLSEVHEVEIAQTSQAETASIIESERNGGLDLRNFMGFDLSDRVVPLQEPTGLTQDEIIDQAFEGKTPQEKPTAILSGGPAGAGKSTAMQGLDLREAVHIDPDGIKVKLGDARSDFHEVSAEVAQRTLERALLESYDLFYDSGMTNYFKSKTIIDTTLGRDGKVEIAFSNIEADTSVARSTRRALTSRDGRIVPLAVTINGYNKALPTFLQLYEEYSGNENVTFTLLENNVDNANPKVIINRNAVEDQRRLQKLMDTPRRFDGKGYIREEVATVDEIRGKQDAIQARILGNETGSTITTAEELPAVPEVESPDAAVVEVTEDDAPVLDIFQIEEIEQPIHPKDTETPSDFILETNIKFAREQGASVNSQRNTATVYHGTSKRNANAILSQGRFKDYPFFAFTRDDAMKFGQQAGGTTTVIELEIDLKGVLPTSNFFTSNGESIYRQSDGTWSNQNPEVTERLMYQTNGAELSPGKSLAALHNLTAENLMKIKKIGGLPMPSVAVIRKTDPFEVFGDITLVGNRELVDPAKYGNRIFDRDIWSPRVPKPEWKMKGSLLEEFDSKWRAAAKELEGHAGLNSLSSSDKDSPDRLVNYMQYNDFAKYAFLKEVGEAPPIIMKSKEYQSYAIGNEQFQEFINSKDPTKLRNASHGDDIFIEVSEAYRQAVTDEANEIGEPDIAEFYIQSEYGDDGLIYFSKYDRIVRDAIAFAPGESTVDIYAMYDAIAKKTEELIDEYTVWLEDQIEPAYSEPFLKLRGKKTPYTIRNIYDYMNMQKTKGSEKNMTFNLSQAASAAGREFKDIEEVRQGAGRLVSEEEFDRFLNERITPLSGRVADALIPFYRFEDLRSTREDMHKSIFEYISKGSKRKSPARMRSTLSKNDFVNVDEETVDLVVDLAHEMIEAPTKYFEAKPQRIVHLDEFQIAIVPEGTSERAVEVLHDNGIQTVTYTDRDDRYRVTQSVFAHNEHLLFQEEIPTSEISQLEDFNNKPLSGDSAFIQKMNRLKQERVDRRQRVIDALKEGIRVFHDTTSELGAFAILHKSSRPEYKWQMSYFDNKGPSRHQSSDTVPFLIENMEMSGKYEPGQPAESDLLFQDDHEQEVIDALGRGEQVPDKVIESYQDKEWAKNELDRRTRLESQRKTLSWLYDIAEEASSLKQFVDQAMTFMTDEEDFRQNQETYDEFFERIYNEARLKPVLESSRKWAKEQTDQDIQIIADQVAQVGPEQFNATPLLKMAGLQAAAGKKVSAQISQRLRAMFRKNPITWRKEVAMLFGDRGALDLIEQETIHSREQGLAAEDPKPVVMSRKQVIEALTYAGRGKRIERGDISGSELTTLIRSARKELDTAVETEKKLKDELARDVQTFEKQRQKLSEIQQQAKIDKQEAVKAALKKASEERREKAKKRRELKKIKERMRSLGRSISRSVPKSVHYEYREMIETLQAALDPNFRRESTIKKWENRNLFFTRNPDAFDLLPDKVKKAMFKKSLNDWTLDELESMWDQVQHWKQLGRTKLRAQKAVKTADIKRIVKAIRGNVLEWDREPDPDTPIFEEDRRVWTFIRKIYGETLRPQRVADAIDGGKSFQGATYKEFIDGVNEAENQKLREIRKRTDAMAEIMTALGIDLKLLSSKRTVQGHTITVDQVHKIYANTLNDRNNQAQIHGNKISTALANAFIDTMSDAEKKFVLSGVIGDYDVNFDRLERAHLLNTNERLSKEKNYSPIQRMERNYSPDARSLADEMSQVYGLKRGHIESGMTKKRQQISAKHQKPLNIDGLYGEWLQHVTKQEQYIGMSEIVHDLRRILRDDELRAEITKRQGGHLLKELEKYVDRVANPNIINAHTAVDKAARLIRNNTAIAALAGNMVTVMKQVPSLAFYLPYTNPLDILKGLQQTMFNFGKTREFIEKLDPQMRERSIERDFDELQRKRKSLPGQVKAKVNNTLLKGILIADKLTTTAGWMSVYNTVLRETGDEKAAAAAARDVTLRTQPAAQAKDLPSILANPGLLSLFTQFSNQLNQIWNMTTYDAPQALKNKHFLQATAIYFGVALSGGVIWMMGNRRLPEDGEDWYDAFIDTFLNQLPILGPVISRGRDGWTSEVALFSLPTTTGQIIGAMEDLAAGERVSTAKAKYLAEKTLQGASYWLGSPFVGPRRVIKGLDEGKPVQYILLGGEIKRKEK